MREHPDRETLQQFISGQLGSEDARLTDRHLAVCSECRDRADEVSAKLALQLLDSWLRPDYDEAFERAAEKAADRLAVLWEEGRNTEELLSDLLQAPSPERRRRIASEEKFHNLKLCQLIQSRSREAWFSDPAAALNLADLAVEVTQYLDQGKYGSNLVEDARALAWGYLGNSFRVSSDLWRAEKALQQAWLHHASAGDDVLTQAELLGFTSVLRRDQGLYDEAEQLSDQLIAIYREGQDSQLEGSALLIKGVILGCKQRYQEAILVARTGLERIDPKEDARLLLIGRHNLIWAFSHAGMPGQAQKMIEQSRFLYSDQIDLARLCWLEGLIARDLGDFGKARRRLSEVREFFQHCNLGIDFFLASIDLAEIYTLLRRHQEVKKILDKVIPLGKAMGLYKEVFEARLLYEQASRS